MTESLATKTCTPCRGGIPPLTREQAEVVHAQAPDWQLSEEAHHIERSFRFRNFRPNDRPRCRVGRRIRGKSWTTQEAGGYRAARRRSHAQRSSHTVAPGSNPGYRPGHVLRDE